MSSAALGLVNVTPLDRLAARANAAHIEASREFCRHVIIAGQALIDAKKIVKGAGGSWALWLRENIDFSERTAQVYMQVARDPQRAADSLRQALRQALGDTKSKGAADLNQVDLRGDPADADLRVSSCAALFASGIKPDAVITEPPHGAEHVSAFSELGRVCVDVPLVAVRMDLLCLYLPEVLQRLCEHLRWRGRFIPRDQRLILVFCQNDDAFLRVKARPAPDAVMWEEALVQRLCGPGELVCDPFLQPATAIAALEFGRRFVGCSLDAEVVADTRRQIGAAR